MRKGKVLILVENLSAPFDRRVWREALALKEAGRAVTIISPVGTDRDTERRTMIDGVAIFRFKPLESRTDRALAYGIEWGHALIVMFALAIWVWLRRGFDVIQICNPPDLLFLAALPFKLLGKKIIFDHHDLAPEVYRAKKGGGSPLLYRVLLGLERATFASADVVISTNASYRELAMRRGGKQGERVFVVRNGPSLKEIRRVDPLPTLREGRPFLMVYVGIMAAQDGIDLLLRSIHELAERREGRDFLLVLFGDGPEYEAARRRASELGIEDLVRFKGRVPFDAVLQGIASADLCLCPDPFTEMNDKSTLVKVVEYLSLGKPVVAFDLTETKITAGNAALYARPNDPSSFAAQIERLLDSEQLRVTLGERGARRFRSQLAWDYAKANLLAAYEATENVKRRGPRRRSGRRNGRGAVRAA